MNEEELEEKKKRRKKRKKKRKVKKKKGKRDACYHKVKARYSVWPSAYASGALVKCRRVGAKNWGNKSKKNEELEINEEKMELSSDEVDKLKDVQKGLQGAVKAHGKQEKTIGDILDNSVEEQKLPSKKIKVKIKRKLEEGI
tara:strand:+ start:258 stop:683 length:426 start_codon:yes stop_codon:yes gene_type:complete